MERFEEFLDLFCVGMLWMYCVLGAGIVIYRVIKGEWPFKDSSPEATSRSPHGEIAMNGKLLRNPWKNGTYANHLCFCGSLNKLKNCHGQEYALTEKEMKKARILYDKWEDSPDGQKFFQELRGKDLTLIHGGKK